MGTIRNLHKSIDGIINPIYINRIRKIVNGRMRKSLSGYILNDMQKSQINDIYGKYGFKIDYTAHEFYAQKTGAFNPYYLPDDIWFTYIDNYYNDADMAYYFDNKCEYQRLFPNVNRPSNILYRENGIWFNENESVVSEKEIIATIRNEGDLFIKEAKESSGGHGVTFYSAKDGTTKEFYDIIAGIEGDLVVQRGIVQHDSLKKLNESSVNTIRVLSFFDKEQVHIVSSILRMGINGAKVDNASSGGITCGISDNGRLKSVAYKANGERYENHPSSNVIFDGYEVPSYKKIIECVDKTHPSFPYFRLISWDFAVDSEGVPVFVEANLRQGELDFHQLNNGAVFEPYIDEMFKEVFHKD
jgi:hypothetical protein